MLGKNWVKGEGWVRENIGFMWPTKKNLSLILCGGGVV